MTKHTDWLKILYLFKQNVIYTDASILDAWENMWYWMFQKPFLPLIKRDWGTSITHLELVAVKNFCNNVFSFFFWLCVLILEILLSIVLPSKFYSKNSASRRWLHIYSWEFFTNPNQKLCLWPRPWYKVKTTFTLIRMFGIEYLY